MADPHHLSIPISLSSPPATRYSHRHRKRISLSRLSSDTAATLPPYRLSPLTLTTHAPAPAPAIVPVPEEFEQPPDYPDTDSAEEADEETDDQVPPFASPPPVSFSSSFTSPRRRRRGQHQQQQPRQGGFYVNSVSQSDIYLDVRLVAIASLLGDES